MSIAEVVEAVALDLRRLATEAGLDLEHSPAALLVFKRCESTLNEQIDYVEALLSRAGPPSMSTLRLAQLRDLAVTIGRLLSGLEKKKSMSMSPAKVVAQLSEELLTVTDWIAKLEASQEHRSRRYPDEEPPKLSDGALTAKRQPPVSMIEGEDQVSGDVRSKRRDVIVPFARQVKRRELKKRRDQLVTDYETANKQLGTSLDEVQRNRIKRLMEDLFEQIEQIEYDLKSS